MKLLNFFLVFCLLQVQLISEAANILAIAPTGSRSHFFVQQPLYKSLAARGHKITVISPFPNKIPIANYTDIPLLDVYEWFESVKEGFTNSVDENVFEFLDNIFKWGIKESEMIAFGTGFQELLKSNSTFDLIMLEMSLIDFALGLGHFYNAPIIGISVMGPTKWVNDYTGNPNPVSYIPNVNLPFTNQMNFYERLENLIYTFTENVYSELIYQPHQEQIYNKVFPDPKPKFSEVRKNGLDLSFVNMHFSLSYGRPYVSNMIEVGGMHISRDSSDLPNDIKEFIEGAENGVIYFSLGSNVLPNSLSTEKRSAILNALLKRKEHIIWKWEGAVPEVAGRHNFMISKWLPQNDILRHPKVKLFVTHGGLLSTTETIYYGVPIVGIPFFGDQHLNMANSQKAGYAITVSYNSLTEESLTSAIDEVINNTKYLETVTKLSSLLRDQPLHPLDTAVYWVEYVIRHKGSKHMRSVAMDLNWIQLNSVDTNCAIAAIIILSVSFFIFTIKLFLSKLLRLYVNTKVKKD